MQNFPKILQNYLTFNVFFGKKSGKISHLDLWQLCTAELCSQHFFINKNLVLHQKITFKLNLYQTPQVGIKSLPQEWLWCATWCSDESKKRAKTIDLCNNPLTKEPKLEAAVRLVEEWPGYDDQIKSMIERFEKGEPPRVKVEKTNKPVHDDL